MAKPAATVTTAAKLTPIAAPRRGNTALEPIVMITITGREYSGG